MAEGQPHHLRSGSQSSSGVQSGHALDQRQQGRLRSSSPGHRMQGLGTLCLGNHCTGHAHLHQLRQRTQVLGMPGCSFRVDAHQQACALRAFQRFHGLGQRLARALLVGRCHGVLPVGDHHVGTAAHGLSKALGARGRNEKKGGGLSCQIVHAYVLAGVLIRPRRRPP